MVIPNTMPLSPKTTLSGSMTSVAVQASVTSAAVFPAVPFLALITTEDNPDFSSWDISKYEVIEVEEVSGTTLKQITRAVEGTVKTWPAGSWIMCGSVSELFKRIKEEFDTHKADNTPHREAVSIERKNPDDDGVFTLIEFRRSDGTLFKTSQLNGTSSYTSRTVKYYDKNGNLVQTVEYSTTYSDDGEVISEVIISAE